MKAFLSFILPTLLTSGFLSAQSTPPRPGQDLLELFDKMHQEGATEDDLRKMLDERLRDETQTIPEADPGDASPQRIHPPARIGVHARPLTPSLRNHFGLERGSGLLVESVVAGSPAAKQGIARHDILVSANGKTLGTLEQLRAIVRDTVSDRPEVELSVIQKGRQRNILVRLAPADGETAPSPAALSDPERISAMEARLKRQQHEIESLRQELEALKLAFRTGE